MTHHLSRRNWLASTTTILTSPYWFTATHAHATTTKNDRPVAAVIGSGGRGTSMAWHQFGRHADLVAICDADLRKAERAAATIEAKLGHRPKIYQDYRELLDRSDIDVVGNATPDHWHTKINVDACLSGKDVYAEKPLTFSIDEGQHLRDAVSKTGRILQVGSQQRSSGQFRTACELVRNGRIGQLRRVGVLLPFNSDGRGGSFASQPIPKGLDWDLWQGQAAEKDFCPERLRFRRWREYAAGMITDWGHHHFDIAHWGMGMDDSGPLAIDAKGDLQNVERVNGYNNIDVFAGHLTYPGDIDLWCVTVRDQKYHRSLASGYPSRSTDAEIFADVPEEIKKEQRNGVVFLGDEGRIFVNRGGLYGAAAEELKKQPLPPDAIRLYESHDHMGNLIDCMKFRMQPICNVEIGHRSVTACHLVNISMRIQRKITWDPVAEQIVGDVEANGMLSRRQRSPYAV